jgi:membrane protein YdbS with pleckstrin-like domain
MNRFRQSSSLLSSKQALFAIGIIAFLAIAVVWALSLAALIPALWAGLAVIFFTVSGAVLALYIAFFQNREA